RAKAVAQAVGRALSAARHRASTEAGFHDASGAVAGERAAVRDRGRAGTARPGAPRPPASRCHSAFACGAHLMSQESRDAAVGSADPRTVVPALRARLHAAAELMRPLSIVHTENSCGWGGQEIRILTEARGMQDRGHRVTLLTPPEAPIAAAGARMGLSVVPVPIQKKRPPGLLALRNWIAAHRSDIDVVNSHSSTDSWLCAIACAT